MGTLSVDKLVKTSSGAAEFTLPAADGTSGQAMITDGSGQLSLGDVTVPTDGVGVAQLSATGTASGSTALFGDNAWKAVSDVSGLASVQVFTTLGSQPWTRPTGITKVIVEVLGGGGSGGKRNSNGAAMGGGGGGGYAKKLLDVSSIASATIVVGAGGASQTTNDTNGNAGVASSWSDGTNTITGNGGTGGEGTTPYGRKVGGTGVGGDFNVQGGTGTAGGGSNYAGSTIYGEGGCNIWTGQMTTDPPSGYGAGSGGGYQVNTDAGGQGIVIVTEYK